MEHRCRRRLQQASVESSDAPTYEENLVERLARSLERSGFTVLLLIRLIDLEQWVLMAPRIPWWLYPG